MVKKLFIIFLLALPLLLIAETPTELIELVTDDIETAAWDSLYLELLSSKATLKLDNRVYLEEDANRSLHSLLYKRPGQTLLLNYKRDWDDNKDRVNIQAEITSKNLIRQAVFGHYRLRFGRGLAIGNGQRGFPDEVFTLGKPAGPDTYVPFGAAARLRWTRFHLLGFGSVLNRNANLSGDLITSLPSATSEASGSVLESLFGAAVSYETKPLRLGALYYRQIYDHDFASPERASDLTIRSLYGAVRIPEHKLDAEATFATHSSQEYFAWEYSHAGFLQSVSFTSNPDFKQVSYSTPAAILSRDTHTNEIAWDASFPLRKYLSMRLRYALNYNERQSFSTHNIRSRFAAILDYKTKTNFGSLSVYNFDREILVPGDNSYSVTLPRNWRAELRFGQTVFPGLDYKFQFRYHVEDKNGFDQNSFFFANSFSYRYRDFTLGASYKSWKNFRQYIYYEDDTLEAYNTSQRDDSVLDLSAGMKLWHLNTGLSYRVSLTGDNPQRLILRLGMAI